MLHRTTIAILLGVIIQQIEGFERVIVVSESNVIGNDEDAFATSTTGSGSYVFNKSCCVFGNCSCPSLYNALANLTSNILINITTDVVLSSIIRLVDLADVAIIGHHNLTVNCNNTGGLHFISCHNCIIEGITWNGCGARNISNDEIVYPVLQLFNSSNITIKNCTFQHSIGQAVVLSEMTGDVNIDHCNFSSNKQYEGHGTAIHYSSNNMLTGSPVVFMITGCHFLHNERAKSVTYFGQSSSAKLCEYLSLHNSNFYHNRGIPIYISNQNFYISGNIEFHNNSAENGGGMFISDYSNVIFHNGATVNFTNNTVTANNNGWAIFLTNHSSILFKEHPALHQCHDNGLVRPLDSIQSQSLTVLFDNNKVNRFGQDIYVHNNSNIVIGGTAHVMFNGCNDCASNAMYVNYHCAITFEGNSTVTFNGYGGVMHIDYYSNITFQGNTAVRFDSGSYYYSNNLHGGAMYINDHCTITFQEKSKVLFIYTGAINGGVMYINSSTVTFQGHSVVGFYHSFAKNGGVMYVQFSTVTFQESSNITFASNYADGNGGVIYTEHSPVTFQDKSNITFVENHVDGNGGVMYTEHSPVTFKDNSNITFVFNSAEANGGVMYTEDSPITFQGNSNVTFVSNIAEDNGGVMYTVDSPVTFQGNSNVTFVDNYADDNGGVMYTNINSPVTFQGNSNIIFVDNYVAGNGGVMLTEAPVTFQGNSNITFASNYAGDHCGVMCTSYCTVTFQENSNITFAHNRAEGNGGVMYNEDSSVTFKDYSNIALVSNRAEGNGGVMYNDNSSVTFQDNSNITFVSNHAKGNGGVMYNEDFLVTFKDYSNIALVSNRAEGNGGVMYNDNSSVTFQDNSNITFVGNFAGSNGGVMSTSNENFENSPIIFQGNLTVSFFYNVALLNGGALYVLGYFTDDSIIFRGNSTVKFCNNKAGYNSLGGAILINSSSTIKIEESCKITFCNNSAYIGGAIVIDGISTISIKGYSTVTCFNNEATLGGVMFISQLSNVTFEGDSRVAFYDYRAALGGAIYIYRNSAITFQGHSKVTFYDSQEVDLGGTMYIYENSTIAFKEYSNVTFNNNAANLGGVMYIHDSSTITFEGNSKVAFTNNYANGQGGAIYIVGNSAIAFKGNSVISFYKNKVDGNGGSLYNGNNSTVEFEENSKIVFIGNTADSGGAIFSKSSSVIIVGNSFVKFIDNIASGDGGAIYLSDQSHFTQLNNSNVTFYHNSASDYGGAVYVLLKDSSINFNSSGIHFIENTARTVQNSVYINILQKTYVNDSLIQSQSVNIDNNINISLTTSPNSLVLYNPAKCIDRECDTYYINNIMLGQEITFDACVLDYYNQPTEAIQFSITGMNHPDYKIFGQKYISISCNRTIQGMNVFGNLQSNKSYNYSVNISLYVTRASEFKLISVNLIAELTPCHPGFWYSNESQKCECYDAGNVISCSGRNSSIKRGYWFGSVTGKPTVTSCPNDYCNFTCCEISNGVYHLSPVRANQCMLHRSGTACGSCEEGYTLSFDSPECVEVNRCTIGAALVITLSLLYWAAVVVAVFAMTHFKVTIGSLYAIVYYYSVVDILLSRVLFISNGLYTTVSIMSSFAKLTPQFLGDLCLVRNMSGIDQQFIHYVHPLVILLILIILSLLARRSRRVSFYVSRGIIQFICFLLLLSYTSLATTSLLLMRPLKFMDIDKVYTYLSPDIEYLHGRHSAYITIAIIFTLVIVIGFPFLLLSEPFLNSKINFIKIKPLLDQFQGCYKDKYRYFAGYYMVCRLVIILLVIVKISDDFTTQYLLISSCALMQLIHVLVRPYVSTIHNTIDGIILQLIVIISVLPIVEFVDIYDEIFVEAVVYLLVILPLINFIGIKIWINRSDIQKSFKRLISIKISINDPQEPVQMKEFDTIVDDSLRENLLVIDVNEASNECQPNNMLYRDSFIEQLNEIEAFNDIKS